MANDPTCAPLSIPRAAPPPTLTNREDPLAALNALFPGKFVMLGNGLHQIRDGVPTLLTMSDSKISGPNVAVTTGYHDQIIQVDDVRIYETCIGDTVTAYKIAIGDVQIEVYYVAEQLVTISYVSPAHMYLYEYRRGELVKKTSTHSYNGSEHAGAIVQYTSGGIRTAMIPIRKPTSSTITYPQHYHGLARFYLPTGYIQQHYVDGELISTSNVISE